MRRVTNLGHHGDVTFRRVTVQDCEIEPAPYDRRGMVLAECKTGGYHALFCRGARLCRYKAGYHAVVGCGARLCRYKAALPGVRVAVVDGDDDAEVRVVGGAGPTPISLAPWRYEVRIRPPRSPCSCFDPRPRRA